jgi:hypothetical protein
VVPAACIFLSGGKPRRFEAVLFHVGNAKQSLRTPGRKKPKCHSCIGRAQSHRLLYDDDPSIAALFRSVLDAHQLMESNALTRTSTDDLNSLDVKR